MKTSAHSLPPSALIAAHAVSLPADGTVPDWVHLIPAGEFSGRDGRGPYLLDAQAVMSSFVASGVDIPFDYDHQTQRSADNGKPAPASGWVKELQSRDNGLWGRVEWTDQAAAALQSKEYRYVSPVFIYLPKTDGSPMPVVALQTVALTNTPNLFLTALNSQAFHSHTGDVCMDLDQILADIRWILNLPETSTTAEISQHLQRVIDAMKSAPAQALNSQLGVQHGDLAGLISAAHASLGATPDPQKFVPRAEYDRVSVALNSIQAQQQTAQAEHSVTAAINDGKLLPAQKEWAMHYCKTDAQGFASFVAAAPVVAPLGQMATHSQAQTKPQNPLLADAERRCK